MAEPNHSCVHEEGLSQREERLGEIVFSYLAGLETGESPTRSCLLASHPEFGAELEEYLVHHERLDQMAAPLRQAVRGLAEPVGIVGDYRLIREVGRGGMGVVYEAEQISLGRRVALKVLPFAATIDPRNLQRFQNEARAAAGLHHPHIVPVYGVGSERGMHFFTMQFIDGLTLAQFVGRDTATQRVPRTQLLDASEATPTLPTRQQSPFDAVLQP